MIPLAQPSERMSKSKQNRQEEVAPWSRLSMATENYLLSIYHLEEQGARVTASELAEEIKRLPKGEGVGTSLASVGGMIRRMAREKLVEVTGRKEIVFTRSGRKAAESIVRRHRLAERLVVDLLGLDLHKAHVEAHLLEHAISPELEKLIIAKLGNPTTCPFGAPIPGSGYRAPRNTLMLDEAREGQSLVIDKVPEDDEALLEYFVRNSVLPNQPVTVKEAALYRGVIILECGGADVVLSYEVAARIRVRGPE